MIYMVRMPNGSGVEWAECSLIIGTGYRVQVFAWSSIAQSVCEWAFSLLAIRCLRPRVRILHSAEEDNLSPLDSNIACLCQSIEINNNKHENDQKLVIIFSVAQHTCVPMCKVQCNIIDLFKWVIYHRHSSLAELWYATIQGYKHVLFSVTHQLYCANFRMFMTIWADIGDIIITSYCVDSNPGWSY